MCRFVISPGPFVFGVLCGVGVTSMWSVQLIGYGHLLCGPAFQRVRSPCLEG